MRTAKIVAGGYYSDSMGITFRVDAVSEAETARGCTVYYTVVHRVEHSRSRHRLGTSDFMDLVSFAGRIEKRVTRRCKTCRCTDNQRLRRVAWDRCSACDALARTA
jgi:hypothetical protein